MGKGDTRRDLQYEALFIEAEKGSAAIFDTKAKTPHLIEKELSDFLREQSLQGVRVVKVVNATRVGKLHDAITSLLSRLKERENGELVEYVKEHIDPLDRFRVHVVFLVALRKQESHRRKNIQATRQQEERQALILSAELLYKKKNSLVPFIDLHGMSQRDAEWAIRSFLKDQIHQGSRVAVIVHGKGTGVLHSAAEKILEEHKKRGTIEDWRMGSDPNFQGGNTYVIFPERLV